MISHRPSAVICLAALSVALLASSIYAGPTISLGSLLDEMVDRDAAARFPEPEYTCRQASSYDRASVSPENEGAWMANNDRSFFIRTEKIDGRQESVMLDATGPGCVVRIWATSGNPTGNIRVYLDGSDEPVINEPARTLVGGNALVGPPLSKVRARGMNLYLPIPYAKHCKITYDRPNFHKTGDGDDLLYYQINYRTYRSDADVESFSRAAMETSQEKIAKLQAALGTPKSSVAQELQSRETGKKKLGPGENLRLKHTSTAAIRQLMVRVDAEDLQAATRGTTIRIAFDGRETVACPVGDFFGSGVGVNSYTGWWRQVDKDGWMSCYWVMPFQESCEVTVSNGSTQDVEASLKVAVGTWDWEQRSMYFHTNWRHEYPIDTSTKHDWNYVQISGKGVFMGDTLSLVNPVSDWWGEGDEKIYVDGESFPSHFGTGTEDYYGYAWCTPEFFESPFHSQPLAEGPGNFGQVTNTRVRLLDGIPFKQSLRFDMEVWHWKAVEVAYAATTHWYGRPGSHGNHHANPDMLRVIRVERPKPRKVDGATEGESLKVVKKTGGTVEIQEIDHFKWSDNKQLWWRHAQPGDTLVLEFPVAESGKYGLLADLTKAVDYGIVRVTLDGRPLAQSLDLYNNGVVNQVHQLGTHDLTAGNHQLKVDIVGANPQAIKSHMFGIDYLKLERVD